MSVGKFETYNLLLDQLELMVHKHMKANRKKLSGNGRSHIEAIRHIYEKNPFMFDTLDNSICCDEYDWLYKSERHVIFPGNEEILTNLLDAKVDIVNHAPIVFQHDCFILSMPRNFSYKGYRIPSMLVSIGDHERRQQVYLQFFRDIFGGKFRATIDDSEYEDNKGLFVTYNNFESGTGRVSYRANYIYENLPILLRCKTLDEYRSHVSDTESAYAQSLNDEERQLQMYVVKLVCMVGLYWSAFPDALKSGYPGVEPKFMQPKLHGKWNKTTLISHAGTGKTDDTRNYHYRSMFFRQLMAERYYRGEHAHKPIGSRVVFVRDTMVGRDIEAETLE